MAALERALGSVLKQLEDIVPQCVDSGGKGPCIEEAQSGRGFVLFTEEGGRICESDILIPGFNLLPQWLLGATYLIFLLYLFAGVAIASDLFMEGIMQITATTRKVKRKNANGEIVVVEEPVWNWVVANITLMALGTSSPEIMLATVEALLTLGKPAGELGPACIAGSAAYNFLVISAVCTTALPDGQFKKISQLRVYVTTAAWSLWAYVWMLIVYTVWTPDRVTLAEAFLTLGFFVLMVLNAWLVDTQPWKKKKPSKVAPSPSDSGAGRDLEAPAATAAASTAIEPRSNSSAPPNPSESSKSFAVEGPVKTLAHYRHILAARQRLSHKRLQAGQAPPGAAEAGGGEALGATGGNLEVDMGLVMPADPTKEKVMFRSHAYSFLESVGVARVAVTRTPPEGGALDGPLRVFYKTEDGDAIAGLDYVAREGSIYFAPGEKSKYIEVRILDDDLSEPDVTFHVVLLSVEAPNGAAGNVAIVQDRVRVTIVDDDDAGVIGFELPEYEIAFNEKRTFAEVTVVRRRGADGRVQVDYETQDLSAAAGVDYLPARGTIAFETGEKTQKIRVDLLPSFTPETHKALRLVLKDPEGGAELGKRTACKVTLVHRQLTYNKGDPGAAPLKALSNGGSLRLGGKTDSDEAADGAQAQLQAGDPGQGAAAAAAGGFHLWSEWRDQIMSAFSPEEPEEGGDAVGWGGLVMQYINITWKVILFILVPPAKWKGGYPCFFAALGTIIGIVYLVNEAGSLFGCIIGLKEVMVGVSIVAVGTSLPDTLASRIAAVTDPDADAAIGNITGSNGVNVFLGLGLPWGICSVYYAVKGEPYVTPAGDLEFAVMLYAIVGACGIVILAVARRYGGELGGSKRRQYTIAGLLAALWVLYLVLSGLRAYGHM